MMTLKRNVYKLIAKLTGNYQSYRGFMIYWVDSDASWHFTYKGLDHSYRYIETAKLSIDAIRNNEEGWL